MTVHVTASDHGGASFALGVCQKIEPSDGTEPSVLDQAPEAASKTGTSDKEGTPAQPVAKKARVDEAPSELPSDDLRARTTYVPANQPTLLRLPSGMLKQVTLEPGKMVSIGKFGSFNAEDIIGRPYGPVYEIRPDGSLERMNQDVAEVLAENEATNENIFDEGDSQALSYEEIKAMKEAGASGREIIQRQLEGNKNHELRTAYSQTKIMKRKEAKYVIYALGSTNHLGICASLLPCPRTRSM